jgi:predicted transcriptional regulator
MTNQEKIDFISSRIWSLQTWLETHGRKSRKPRPEFDIEQRERHLIAFESIISDYQQRAAQ